MPVTQFLKVNIMAAKYWIKLYHEILHDPKMGRLPDNLWRRCIELFLLAGELGCEVVEEDEKGVLPSTEEIAWHLRQSEQVLEAELVKLTEIGILTKIETGWLVTNFANRQKHVADAERMKQYRERKRKKELQSSDASDTDVVTRSVTKRNIESDKESDKESSPNGEGADAPAAETKKPIRAPSPIPEAIKVYQSITRRLPDKVLWADIETRVGATPENLERWGKVITAYIGCGWNKLNVSGMLRFFEDNRIPTTEPAPKGQPQNGIYSKHNQQKPTGESLEGEPTFNPYTGETVPGRGG